VEANGDDPVNKSRLRMVVRSAGASPAAMPVASASATPNHSDDVPRRGSIVNGAPAIVAMSRPMTVIVHMSHSAAPPPIAATSTLSVSKCRTTRDRLAPTANRMAISRCRAVPRASNNPETLVDTTTSTSSTTTPSAVLAGAIAKSTTG
jgi:hypothetical protein